MKKRFVKHHKSGPPPVGKVFLITAIAFIITVFISLELIDKGLRPTLMEIAKTRTEQVARWAINEAVNKEMSEELDQESLVNIKTDNQGNVEYVGWNTAIINTFLRDATFRVQNYLKRIENGDIRPENALDINVEIEEGPPDLENFNEHPAFTEIPLGQALNNSLLANLGPSIPVHFNIMGTVESNPTTKVEKVGVNGAWVHYIIKFKVTVRIVVPFTTEKAVLTQEIPIDTTFVPGQVPEVYSESGNGGGPEITVPIEPIE